MIRHLSILLFVLASVARAEPTATWRTFARAFDADHTRVRLVMLLSPT